MAGQVQAGPSEQVEREYEALRRSVMAMLRTDFAGVPDHEELYQEAWAEVLELQARGESIREVGNLVRTIAWRRARDRLRNSQRAASAVDPTGRVIGGAVDPAPLPEDEAQVRFEAALIRQVVDSLEPREAAVIKLRFERHLDSREIQAELGVSPKRLEKITTRAYQHVEAALAEPDEGLSEWRRRQRSLLLACEAGLASPGQRRTAQQMLADDPVCRAMLAEIRQTIERVAAVLPLPLLAHGWLARLRVGLGALRDDAADLAGRLGGHSAGVEQASAGAGASIGSGLAVKAALTCFLITGTTVFCVTSAGTQQRPKPHRHRLTHAASRVRPAQPVAPPVAHVTRPVVVHRTTTHRGAVAKAAAPPPPSPAPRASTEFGPGTTGSTATPSTPAAAPTSGSGEFTP